MIRRGHSFDGGDRVALGRCGMHQACIHPPPVEMHRAGTALAVIAALLRAGQAEPFAQDSPGQ